MLLVFFTLPFLMFDQIDAKRKETMAAIDTWARKQSPVVECALIGVGGGVQGAFIGGIMGGMSKMDPNQPAPGMANPQQSMMMNQSPLIMARNFAVLTGSNAGLTAAIKKMRNGKDDVQGAMMASFGSGAAFSLVSGMANAQGQGVVPGMVSTGVVFALMQGAIYQIGKALGGGEKTPETEAEYVYTKGMLNTLGLNKYEKAFMKNQLSDRCLPLLNESSLQDCKIPAGPRLLILNHIDAYYRSWTPPPIPVAVPAGAATSALSNSTVLTPAAAGTTEQPVKSCCAKKNQAATA